MGCATSVPKSADHSAQPEPQPGSTPTQSEGGANANASANGNPDAVLPISIASPKAKIAVVYYSMYGHIATLAKEVAKGVEASGAEATVFQVEETLTEEVLVKMSAPPKDPTVRVLSNPSELDSFDGILFGSGTRFGMMTAQLKALFDRTGGIWAKGGWVGKTAGVFFSTGTQGGGQETTALTMLTQFAHHGLLYVPIGYSSPLLFNMDEIHGGSPYGAGTLAGADGTRQPSKLELAVAEHQGKHFAGITSALKRGREAAAE